MELPLYIFRKFDYVYLLLRLIEYVRGNIHPKKKIGIQIGSARLCESTTNT